MVYSVGKKKKRMGKKKEGMGKEYLGMNPRVEQGYLASGKGGTGCGFFFLLSSIFLCFLLCYVDSFPTDRGRFCWPPPCLLPFVLLSWAFGGH